MAGGDGQLQSYKIYGAADMDKAPSESAEMATFFNKLPPHIKSVAIHVRNEGIRDARLISKMRLEGGFVKGCPDIIVPGCPTLLIEMKSRSKTSKISDEQVKYLERASDLGAMSCICYGWEAAMQALKDWEALQCRG